MSARRTVVVALLALAAFVPSSAAHADPLHEVKRILDEACSVDLCVPPQPLTDRLVCPFLDETPVYDCT